MSDWISVEDRLPAEGLRVIGWCVPNEINDKSMSKINIVAYKTRQWKDGNGKSVGEPFGMFFFDEGVSEGLSFEVTHWYAPSPPESTDNKEVNDG